MCPHCGSTAPVVHHGLAARCTACGRPRSPLATKSTALAGQPAKVGGTLARLAGWIVLAVGAPFALLVYLLLHALFPEGSAATIVAAPLLFATLLVTGLLVRGGRKLQDAGAAKEATVHDEALFALAQRYRGVLTAEATANELGLTPGEADTLLTALAKRDPDRVKVEVSDAGQLQYQFPRHLWADVAWQDGKQASAGARVSGAAGARVSGGAAGEEIGWDEHVEAAEARARAAKKG